MLDKTDDEIIKEFPNEYERGKQDAIQFAYIPEDYTKNQLRAWTLGYRYQLYKDR